MNDESFSHFVPNVHFELIPIKDLVSNLIINVPIVNAQMSENEIKKLVERINKIPIILYIKSPFFFSLFFKINHLKK